MNWPSRVASITLAAALLWVANARSAHAANAGVGEMGVALVQPIADGGYRGDFQTSPALWLAGVYLPEFGEREFGVELGFEWTSYWDDYRDVLGRSTEFHRMRLQVGVRYFRPIVPRLTGFARLLAGVDLFGWDQRGRVGTLAYQDADDHIGLAVEAGAGVMYELGKVAFGAQLAVPVGVHREEKFDGTLEINQTAFDLELRFTIGTRY